MIENMLVSVIIPVYNVEEYVSETLESVLAQSIGGFEIICVNDGSTDESGDIIESYAARDERVRCVHQENRGLSAARNAGIKLSVGKYIYFLDSDDLIERDCLRTLVDKAEKENTDIILFDGQTFFDSEELEKKLPQYKDFYKRKGDYSGGKQGSELFADMMLRYEFYPQASLYFYRRSFLHQQQLKFPEGILHEDNLFAFRALMAARSVLYLDKILFHRRIRKNSIITSTVTKRNVWGNYYTSVKILEFLDNESINDRVFYASCCLAKNRMKDAEIAYEKITEEEKKQFGMYFLDPSLVVLILVRLEKEYRDYLLMSESIENKDKEINRIAGIRSELYNQVKSLRGEMGKKNQWLQEKDERISEKDERIKQQAKWLAEKDERIQLQAKWISEKDERIARQEDIISGKNLDIVQLNQIIKKQREQIRDNQDNINRLELEVKSRQSIINKLRDSASYRIGRAITYLPRKILSLFRLIRSK